MMSDGRRPVTPAAPTVSQTDQPDSAGCGSVDVTRLVVEHHGDVYRYAYRLAGSVADAEDLTQQTFLLAQAHRAQLRDPALARRWLFSILRHEFFRGQRKQRPTPAGMLADVCDTEAPAEGPIDQEALQRALNELPDEFKIVLLLFYFEERSYREIAEELELPLGTVMSRLSRAKRHLRGKLSGSESAERAKTNETTAAKLGEQPAELKPNGQHSPLSSRSLITERE